MDYRKRPEVVWIGTHDLTNKSEGKVIPIVDYQVHPKHSQDSHYNDIALLEIKEVVLGEQALPACLYPRLDDPHKMQLLGWGAANRGISNGLSRNPPNTIKQGPRPRKKYSFFTKVTECFSGYFDLTSTPPRALSLARQH